MKNINTHKTPKKHDHKMISHLKFMRKKNISLELQFFQAIKI